MRLITEGANVHTLDKSSSAQAKPTSFNINTSLPVYCAAFKPKMSSLTQENAGRPAKAQHLGIFTSSSGSNPPLGGWAVLVLPHIRHYHPHTFTCAGTRRGRQRQRVRGQPCCCSLLLNFGLFAKFPSSAQVEQGPSVNLEEEDGISG